MSLSRSELLTTVTGDGWGHRLAGDVDSAIGELSEGLVVEAVTITPLGTSHPRASVNVIDQSYQAQNTLFLVTVVGRPAG